MSLVTGVNVAALGTPVPACPGWSVRDVMAHLTAVAEDVLAGTLTRPPSDAETAAQVGRFEGLDLSEIVFRWGEAGPQIEPLVFARQVWPAVLDVASHEQDIRGAIGMPGGRDSEPVMLGAEYLIAGLRPPIPMLVVLDEKEFRVGPFGDPGMVLRTDRFEAFRWRLGRRSRKQLMSLDWSADPSSVIDHLTVFGPATNDLLE